MNDEHLTAAKFSRNPWTFIVASSSNMYLWDIREKDYAKKITIPEIHEISSIDFVNYHDGIIVASEQLNRIIFYDYEEDEIIYKIFFGQNYSYSPYLDHVAMLSNEDCVGYIFEMAYNESFHLIFSFFDVVLPI